VGEARSTHDMVSAYNILIGKPEGKRPLGRPKCRCRHNNRLDLKGNIVGLCGLYECGSG